MWARTLLLALVLVMAPFLGATPTYNSDWVAYTDATPGTSPITHSFTMATVSNGMLMVAVSYEVSTTWTATYNGVTMSVATANAGGSNYYQSVFYLATPTAGANNLVLTASPNYFSGPVGTMIWSYAGTSATVGTIASGTGAPTATNTFPVTWSLTPLSTTSEIVQVGSISAGGCAGVTWTLASTLGTARGAAYTQQNNNKGMGVADGLSPGLSATNITLTFTASCSSSSTIVGTGVELLSTGSGPTPTPTPTPGSGPLPGSLMMLGVGK